MAADPFASVHRSLLELDSAILKIQHSVKTSETPIDGMGRTERPTERLTERPMKHPTKRPVKRSTSEVLLLKSAAHGMCLLVLPFRVRSLAAYLAALGMVIVSLGRVKLSLVL